MFLQFLGSVTPPCFSLPRQLKISLELNKIRQISPNFPYEMIIRSLSVQIQVLLYIMQLLRTTTNIDTAAGGLYHYCCYNFVDILGKFLALLLLLFCVQKVVYKLSHAETKQITGLSSKKLRRKFCAEFLGSSFRK